MSSCRKLSIISHPGSTGSRASERPPKGKPGEGGGLPHPLPKSSARLPRGGTWAEFFEAGGTGRLSVRLIAQKAAEERATQF